MIRLFIQRRLFAFVFFIMSLLSSSILLLFVLLHSTLCGQTVLNISMLNSGETVSLPLLSYLNASKQATIDRVHSSKNI
jgi:hypothetical protein